MKWAVFIEDVQSCARQFGEIASHVGAALLLAQMSRYDRAIEKLGDAAQECKDALSSIEQLIANLKELTRG